jgi:hypothetical protein
MNNGFVGPVQTVTLDGKEYFENLEEGFSIGERIDQGDVRGENERSSEEEGDEEGFVVNQEEGDEEGFANVVRNQEEAAPYPNPPAFTYVEPAAAIQEINKTAMFTSKDSLMMESGAPDEQKKAERGADLDAAFAAPLIKA